MKISSEKEARKLQEALRIKYNRFAKDFTELGKRYRKLYEDSNAILEAEAQMLSLK